MRVTSAGRSGRSATVLCASVVFLVFALVPSATAGLAVAHDVDAPASTALPATPCATAPPAPMRPGIEAHLQFGLTASSGPRCRALRVAQALAVGAAIRDQVTQEGATCTRVDVSHRPGSLLDPSGDHFPVAALWVCSPYHGVYAERGGTTWGDTFVTAQSQDAVLADPALVTHEARHVAQWFRYGTTMAFAYVAAGTDPCRNVFEQDAGWADGGYRC